MKLNPRNPRRTLRRCKRFATCGRYTSSFSFAGLCHQCACESAARGKASQAASRAKEKAEAAKGGEAP